MVRRRNENSKQAKKLTLSDSIIMPSGVAYPVQRLEWFGTQIMVEVAHPDSGNCRIEFLTLDGNKKVDVE